MNYLLEYYEQINNGSIIAGEDLRNQLAQLIKDLDNPRYYFDEKP